MRTKLWTLLLVFLFVFPSIAQEVPIDSISVISQDGINEVTLNDELQAIPNEGFTITGLGRGILGMLVLLLIAYLFSANRKAINWKTVGIGLSLQILIAIGVLKVRFIQYLFDQVWTFIIQTLGPRTPDHA